MTHADCDTRCDSPWCKTTVCRDEDPAALRDCGHTICGFCTFCTECEDVA